MKEHLGTVLLVALCVLGLTLYLWHGKALEVWLWGKRSNIMINRYKRRG
jgi:hypothetical protein